MSVRYREANPSNARLDTFLAIWGDTVVYGGILELVLLVVFFHPQIVPYSQRSGLFPEGPLFRSSE